MQQVLLLDFDVRHAEHVVKALATIFCQTVVRADLESALGLLHEQKVEVVIVAPAPGEDWIGVVEAIRHEARQMDSPLHIVCLLPGPYRGPNERVYAARKGFTVIYER
jgi:hypothetical protein